MMGGAQWAISSLSQTKLSLSATYLVMCGVEVDEGQCLDEVHPQNATNDTILLEHLLHQLLLIASAFLDVGET